MKIMSFNLRIHVPSDGDNAWPHRIPSVLKMIASHQPDVLGTQEATDAMLDDLQPLENDYFLFGEGRNADRHGEGCYIAVKKTFATLISQETVWLSATPLIPGSMDPEEGFPRIVTIGILRLHPTGELIRIMNTHFAYRSDRAREQNRTTLVTTFQTLQARQPLPTILMGDFNCPGDHPIHTSIRLAGFVDGFRVLNRTQGPTFHAFQGVPGTEAIDFIYATPDWMFKTIEIDYRKIDQRYPSDHFPVIAEVQIKK